MKRLIAYKKLLCPMEWFRKKGKSVTAIKDRLRILLLILSDWFLFPKISSKINRFSDDIPTEIIKAAVFC